MKRFVPAAVLAAVFAFAAAASAQRIEFPRQSFDRTRFMQTGGASAQPPAAPVARPTQAPLATPPAAQPAATATPPPAQPPQSSEFPRQPPPGVQPTRPGQIPQDLVDNPRFDLVPKKAYDNARDYDEILELQRQTGAILLVTFLNNNDSHEKGLCGWYNKAIEMTRDFQRATRPYIRLTVNLPGNARTTELANRYKVNSTPAIFIHQPNNMPMRLQVFDWINKDPKPRAVEDVIRDLLDRSTPAYKAYVPTLL